MSAIAMLQRDEMRAKVRHAEREMIERGERVEIPVEHVFSHGLYARKITIPAGTVLTGKIHKRENLNFLLAGEMSVLTEGGVQRVGPGFMVVSPPGTKRIAYTHTECVWVTVHGTKETDLEKIEAEFIAQSEQEYLEFEKAIAQQEVHCLGSP
jgi:quercetin dioxygenase-like cupin family protein